MELGETLLWTALALLCLQPFLVAIIAAQKDLSAGIWFMVSFMWVFAATLGWLFLGLLVLSMIAELIKKVGVASEHVGLIAFVAVFAFFGFLPTWAVLFTKSAGDRYRAAKRPGRRFRR